MYHNSLRALVLAMMIGSCSSPMELDVSREMWYTDGAIHPNRLTLYYYFGDSAYEAIVTDTSFLNQIWIERGHTPWQVTVPQFVFQLDTALHATWTQPTLVRAFCFSFQRYNVDALYRSCQNANSWIEGEYLDITYSRVPFRWMTNDSTKVIQIAWFKPEEQNLLKGRLQIQVLNPSHQQMATFNGLLTMEF